MAKKKAARKSAPKKSAGRKTSKKSAAKTGGTKKAAKRELIDTGTSKRYVRRAKGGQFKEVDEQGRSLSQDRRRKAKRATKSGQGDRGDRRSP
jgi:hypothetical protein